MIRHLSSPSGVELENELQIAPCKCLTTMVSPTELQGPRKENSGCSQSDILIELSTCSPLKCCPPALLGLQAQSTSHLALVSARHPYRTWLCIMLIRRLGASPLHTVSRVESRHFHVQTASQHSVSTPRPCVKPCHVICSLPVLSLFS